MKLNIIIILFIIILIYLFIFNNKKISADKFDNLDNLDYSNKLGIDFIDAVYYINLDHRTDRNTNFINEMNKINFPSDKIFRVSAVYKPSQGDLGCSLSHIKVLEQFINSNFNNCIIFEDDFEFTLNPHQINDALFNLFYYNIDFDVCMLASNTIYDLNTNYPFLKKIISAQTASGYIVSKKFAITLLDNYIRGATLLQQSYNDGNKNSEYCVDQYFKLLQPNSNWLVFEPKLGKQLSSYSDIQNSYVQMNV